MGTQGFGSPALPPLGFYLPPFFRAWSGSPGFYSLGTPGLYRPVSVMRGQGLGTLYSSLNIARRYDGLIRSALSLVAGALHRLHIAPPPRAGTAHNRNTTVREVVNPNIRHPTYIKLHDSYNGSYLSFHACFGLLYSLMYYVYVGLPAVPYRLTAV